ncbi:hypothetical protein HJC23_008472 [Cyclotella cryptica]|uniref:Transmembrane protein 186 n=1 Tax=Cyclotella cryptica TaxID=29204 RepID=A0ABD3QWI3_9STRA|eukprot:CCRYP_001197-RA/>CCRYP_001197-RA protein AED:0.22 eAED:0.22 QI:76/1/1/1/0/0/2/834/283
MTMMPLRVTRRSAFSSAAALRYFHVSCLRQCGAATVVAPSPCSPQYDDNHSLISPSLSSKSSDATKFHLFSHRHHKSPIFHHTRKFSTDKATNQEHIQNEAAASTQQPILIYESPFASLTLKLKRISLTSAAIGLIGLPALSFFYGSAGGVPPTGQLAVIATAGVTAVGSTALLGYCFSPYVHTLEIIPDDNAEEGRGKLVRIVTRDVFARKVVTVFDPNMDVSRPGSGNSRPFCNFVVRGMPFYIHPDLLTDGKLRVQLLREEGLENAGGEIKRKTDDDEFL